ncbi:MAG: hypothetical protein AAF355_15515 [Myxococcota bacterium]
MPFRGPHRRFRPGDLVYGLNLDFKYPELERIFCLPPGLLSTRIRNQFLAQVYPNWEREKLYVFIDQYNRRFLAVEPSAKQIPIDQRPDPQLKTINFNYNKTERPSGLPPHVQEFRNYLESVPGRDPREVPLPVHRPARIRRACKGGIEWILQPGNERHIHFILEGIDHQAVVEKNARDDNTQVTGYLTPQLRFIEDPNLKIRNYTGSELRWIFRHRRDPRVQAKVQFWRYVGWRSVWGGDSYVPCPPPWEKGPNKKYWDWYEQRRRKDGKSEYMYAQEVG